MHNVQCVQSMEVCEKGGQLLKKLTPRSPDLLTIYLLELDHALASEAELLVRYLPPGDTAAGQGGAGRVPNGRGRHNWK